MSELPSDTSPPGFDDCLGAVPSFRTASSAARRATRRPHHRPVVPNWRPVAVPGARGFALAGLIGASLALPVLFLARGSWPSVWAGLVLLWMVPGCGLAAWVNRDDHLLRLVTAVGGGVTWNVLVSTVLAWQQAMASPLLLALTSGLGAVSCLVSLETARRNRPEPMGPHTVPLRLGEAAGPGVPGPVSSEPDAGARRRARLLPAGLLLAGMGLWIVAVLRARGDAVGDYGMLPLLGVPYALSVLCVVLAVVLALRGRVWVFGAAAGCTALVLVLNATAPLLVSAPLEGWAYKHFGVVDYIVNGGALSDPLDVYQQWPGFFAAAAGLVRLSHVSPLSYSDWATVFFEAMNALTVWVIARVVVRHDTRVPFTAVLLFVACNWEGQRYYAPQTMAFLLALLLQLLALLNVTTPPAPPQRPRWWAWIVATATQNMPRGPALGAGLPVVPGVASVIMFTAITVTHQLTPVLILLSAIPLAVLGVWRLRTAVSVMCVVLLVHFWIHRSALSGMSLLSLLRLSNFTGSVSISTRSEQQLFAADLAHVVALGTWGFTALAVLSYLKARKTGAILGPALMAFMPLSFLVIQNYGGEAVYRAFLMSSPWCAVIIATRLCDLTWRLPIRGLMLITWSVFVALASGQASLYGMFNVRNVLPSEVAASRYYLQHAEPGTVLTVASANFPGRLDGRYILHNPDHVVNDPALLDDRDIALARLRNVDAATVAAFAREASDGCRGYVVVGPFLESYARFYGQPIGTLPAVEQRLRASADWRVWYQNGETTIFETTAGQAPCRPDNHGR